MEGLDTESVDHPKKLFADGTETCGLAKPQNIASEIEAEKGEQPGQDERARVFGNSQENSDLAARHVRLAPLNAFLGSARCSRCKENRVSVIFRAPWRRRRRAGGEPVLIEWNALETGSGVAIGDNRGDPVCCQVRKQARRGRHNGETGAKPSEASCKKLGFILQRNGNRLLFVRVARDD